MQLDLALIADALPACIAYIDSGRRYRFTNRRYEQWVGCSREELWGRHAADVLGPTAYELLQKQIESALSGETARYEGLLPLGGLGDRHVSIVLVPNPAGGVLSVVNDYTEVKRGEEEIFKRIRAMQEMNRQLVEVQEPLIHAERLGAAGDLAIRIAQEINNPLTALIGTLEMSLEASGRPRLKPERLLHLARRIKSVAGGMLQLFREAHFDLEPIDPAELLVEVGDVLGVRAAAQNVALELKPQPGLPRLYSDRRLLRTALLNIAVNGLDAMLDGGTLTLEVASVPGLELVEFRIADTGAGIPSELRKRVSEPFFTTKAGTGLGLSIAQGVIRGHEGRIRIEDRPGGGTTVAVELPLRVDPDEHEPNQP